MQVRARAARSRRRRSRRALRCRIRPDAPGARRPPARRRPSRRRASPLVLIQHKVRRRPARCRRAAGSSRGVGTRRPPRHLRPGAVVGREHLVVVVAGRGDLSRGNDVVAVDETEVELGREPALPRDRVRADVGAREDGGRADRARRPHRLGDDLAAAHLECAAEPRSDASRSASDSCRNARRPAPRRIACRRCRRRATKSGSTVSAASTAAASAGLS